MGSSYSGFPEDETRRQLQETEGRWQEYTISEIDSDSSNADTMSMAGENQIVSGEELSIEARKIHVQQHSEQNQELSDDESEEAAATIIDAAEEESMQRIDNPLERLHARLQQQHQRLQQLVLEASEESPERDVAWGPPPVSAAAISDDERMDAISTSARSNETYTTTSEDELETFFRELGLSEPAGGGGRSVVSCVSDQVSMVTDAATVASIENDFFIPQHSRNFEWMGRSLESLVSGYARAVPILGTSSPTRERRRNRRNSRRDSETRIEQESFKSPTTSPRGRKSRRRSLERCLDPFGSSSSHRYKGSSEHGWIDGIMKRGGPNVALNLFARETTGRTIAPHNRIPVPDRLKSIGGNTLYNSLDRPSAGMCSEVACLEEAIDDADWDKVQAVISRLSPRLIGDPTLAVLNPSGSGSSNNYDRNDPNLPPTAPRFYAGGGRIGLERDAFVLAGGIDVLVRVFREPAFVGAKMAHSNDARDLSKELVATNRLGHCWNESLACLRELVYSIPSLLETERIFDHEREDFLPFLFTLLAHDPFFDGAAALIEEILSLQSHSPQPEDQQEHPPTNSGNDESCCSNNFGGDDNKPSTDINSSLGEDKTAGDQTGPTVRVAPPTTFFLGNISDLYSLWSSFNCRQLAHFCRILALLIFEPEDRQLLESPAVLKSIELLQLRRNRAARAGRDSTVDMNQSILLGDEKLVRRFLDLLIVMNFAPPLRCTSPFHIMAHFPYIADTLMMLGLHEFENWDDIAKYEKLARKALSSGGGSNNNGLHSLGSVAGMLENLSDAFINNEGEPTNQLGHIITVISAAQQAGVVIGRPRQRNGTRTSVNDEEEIAPPPRRDTGLEGMASAAGMLTDQVLLQRQEHAETVVQSETITTTNAGVTRSRVRTPGDAANVMQFNSLLLAPYQVEVLFVLCTLLGGRRKVDAQELLKNSGITRILDDMFQRLPWDSLSPSREPLSQRQNDGGGASGSNNSFTQQDDPSGIHGPGCECTPESALCVQFLRLLHNFCDRDCDNYNGRRLLLSPSERRFIFEDCHIGFTSGDISSLSPGLLSKVIAAFIGESDESPYRFWLASCVESYLRGSSSVEQVFVAKTGLVEHLIDDITSQRLHCAGSLQTSFDLLGELCKGNVEVLQVLVGFLDDEEKFRKLMSVAASNLVDSNVFIRSLLLSLERMSYGTLFHDVGSTSGFDSITDDWRIHNDVSSRGFLTHSWWETRTECPRSSDHHTTVAHKSDYNFTNDSELRRDQERPSDWFPAMKTALSPAQAHARAEYQAQHLATTGGRFRESYGRFGWVYQPQPVSQGSSSAHQSSSAPNTIDRMFWFLTTNRTRLLRDLLEVVNLNNINHENICCLNTAVVITIFANRRNELHELLWDLKEMDEDEQMAQLQHSAISSSKDNPLAPDASCKHNKHEHQPVGNSILRNFREVLWFWVEYYTHRGRDRLSLEFSSRLRFHEWMDVVSLLSADNGAPTALVRRPLPLPQSPYQRTA